MGLKLCQKAYKRSFPKDRMSLQCREAWTCSDNFSAKNLVMRFLSCIMLWLKETKARGDTFWFLDGLLLTKEEWIDFLLDFQM